MTILLAALFAIASSLLSVLITLVIVRQKELLMRDFIDKMPLQSAVATVSPSANEIKTTILEELQPIIIAQIENNNKVANREIKSLREEIQTLQAAIAANKIAKIAANNDDFAILADSLREEMKTLAAAAAPVYEHEINFAAEDFAKLLEGNSLLLDMLREKLHINKLTTSVLSILPIRLEMKNIDELHRDATQHYWRLFEINYLPAFKAEIVQEIENSFRNNIIASSPKNDSSNKKGKTK